MATMVSGIARASSRQVLRQRRQPIMRSRPSPAPMIEMMTTTSVKCSTKLVWPAGLASTGRKGRAPSQKAESYKDDRQRERPPLEDPRQQGGQQGADADDGEQQVRKVHLPGMATVALVNRFRGPGRRAGAAIPTSAQVLRSHGTTGPVAWDHRA